MPSRLTFMSATFWGSEAPEILAAIRQASSKKPVRIATLNPELILLSKQNSAFKEAISAMTHCTVDGTGLLIFLSLGHFLTSQLPFIKRYPGADLVHDLLEDYAQGGRSFYLLGGEEGVAGKAALTLKKTYPNLQIVGAESGGIIDPKNPLANTEVISRIQKAAPDILLVGFGAPKQELWIDQAKEVLEVPVMIGIGGTFGFYAVKKRAPLWMRRSGLEWLYRGLTEEKHWQRLGRAVILFSFQALFWILKRSLLPGKVSK